MLVAIAIPVFTAQLERSRDATSIANIRSAYAEAMTDYLGGDSVGSSDAVEVTKTVMIQTAQGNSWSNQAVNLPFTAPTDPGGVTAATAYNATFSFTTGANSETSVTCTLSAVD